MKNRTLLLFIISICGSVMMSCSEGETSTLVPSGHDGSSTHGGGGTQNPVNLSGLLTSINDSVRYQPQALEDSIKHSMYFKGYSVIFTNLYTVSNSGVSLLVKSRVPKMDSIFKSRVGVCRDGGRKWQVETYCFTYKSVSATGEETILSGRVTFPNDTVEGVTHEVSTLTLYNHQWIQPQQAPSLALSPMTIRSLYNSAVIEPDYEGFGLTAQKPYCGLSYMTLARQTADCAMAALDVMHLHGVKLADDGFTTNWGNSLGAPASLAFAKYYETQGSTQLKEALRLKSTYTGEGPYLIDEILTYLDQHPDFSAFLMSLMLQNLPALPASKFAPYEFKEFCPEWMQTTKQMAYGREMTFFEAWILRSSDFTKIPSSYNKDMLKSYFCSDMCTADGHLDYTNGKVVLLKNLFHELSECWNDWTPVHPVYFTHCPDEDLMPYQQVKDVYEALHERSSAVYWKDVPSGPLSSTIGVHFETSILGLLNMIVAEEPVDIYKMYH